MAKKELPTEHYRLVGTYERLRKNLLEQPDDGRLDKSLSYWVLPTDKRLPIVFLDRQMRELLDEPFEQLLSTPGVGHKKIMGFFSLLKRAGLGGIPEVPFGLPNSPKKQKANSEKIAANGFDPSIVSEALWSTWTETVRRYNFVDHKLGRLAPTLQALPTVIWHSRLGDYADLSLAEIRQLPTHGEKRVHTILQVFRTVHEAVATSVRDENLELDLLPRFIPPLVCWLNDRLASEDSTSENDIRQQVISPMLKQIEIDLGPQVANLLRIRLQTDGQAPSVKKQADEMGVTRARVYQLLDEGANVMAVRWPEGRWLFVPLKTKLAAQGFPDSWRLLRRVLVLLYPEQSVQG